MNWQRCVRLWLVCWHYEWVNSIQRFSAMFWFWTKFIEMNDELTANIYDIGSWLFPFMNGWTLKTPSFFGLNATSSLVWYLQYLLLLFALKSQVSLTFLLLEYRFFHSLGQKQSEITCLYFIQSALVLFLWKGKRYATPIC